MTLTSSASTLRFPAGTAPTKRLPNPPPHTHSTTPAPCHNHSDLYTKASSVPVLEEVWPHYQAIIDKLCPGELDW